MTVANDVQPLKHPNKFFIGGEWVEPSSSSTIDVIDSATEQLFFTRRRGAGRRHGSRGHGGQGGLRRGPVAADDARGAGRDLRALGKELGTKSDAMGQLWPRESGVLASVAKYAAMGGGDDLRLLRRHGRHVPLRGAGRADPRWSVRAAGPRAGGRRRRDHPVERAAACWPSTRSRPRCWPVARSCSRSRRRRRARATCSPRRPRRSGCRRACSTS